MLVLLFSLMACSGGKDSSSISAANGDAANGETLYGANCSGCHGAAGEGGSGPAIAGESDSDENIEIVVSGEEGMPAFGESLSDQDISDIFAFLATL